MKAFYLISILLVSVILTGCNFNFKNNNLNVSINGRTFSLEQVRTEAELTKGLMDRTSLPKNSGMIFWFPTRENLNFWMKNTLIPLQIIFIDGCKIVDIQEMTVEKDPSNAKTYYISKFPADKAIELNSQSVPENIIGQNIPKLCN
jgi:uncharacterized membrane protein (UPF0127 family)